MKKGWIIAAIVAAALVIGGIVFAMVNNSSDNKSSTNSSSSTPSNSNSSTNTSSTGSNASESATITYTSNGFEPATLTVKAGTKVTIKNNSSDELQFDSDPHPVHTDDPELNVGTVAPGSSTTFTPTTTGSHGYHNHLNPSDRGVLIVN